MSPRHPTAFGHHDSKGLRLVVSDEYSKCLDAAGWTNGQGFDEMMARAQRVPGGRGPNWILQWPASRQRIRIRPCRHGGVLGSWFGDRSWSAVPVLREFSLWTLLCQQKIPLPVPVFAISRRQGIFWRSAFASVERERARDGLAWLAENPTSTQIAALCISFAKSTRRFHDAGAIHGDLQIRNILIEPDITDADADADADTDTDADSDSDSLTPERCLLIDLDRTRIVDQVSPRQRMRELLRFVRSLEKTGHGEVASRRFRALVLSAYCDRDRRLRRSMMRWSRLEALGILRHRIAWRVGRLAS